MECDVLGETGRLDIVEMTDKTRLGVRVPAGAGFNDNRCLHRIRKATQMPLNDMTRMQRGKKKIRLGANVQAGISLITFQSKVCVPVSCSSFNYFNWAIELTALATSGQLTAVKMSNCLSSFLSILLYFRNKCGAK